MILQIRTKDDLASLLNNGISYSWKINKSRLESITDIEIFSFDGKAKIIGIFDAQRTQLLENGRVAIAFKNGLIQSCDIKWEGQNPIKYKLLSNSDLPTTIENTDSILDKPDWNIIEKYNPEVSFFISDFCNNKEKDNFTISISPEGVIYIRSNYTLVEPSTSFYFSISKLGCEFHFSSKDSGIYIEILNEFEDFNEYFEDDVNNGSVIAKILREKYYDTYAGFIDSGEDSQIDEDFNIYFIDNFVNYILNNVYFD